jgi:hypothetical protein
MKIFPFPSLIKKPPNSQGIICLKI